MLEPARITDEADPTGSLQHRSDGLDERGHLLFWGSDHEDDVLEGVRKGVAASFAALAPAGDGVQEREAVDSGVVDQLADGLFLGCLDDDLDALDVSHALAPDAVGEADRPPVERDPEDHVEGEGHGK